MNIIRLIGRIPGVKPKLKKIFQKQYRQYLKKINKKRAEAYHKYGMEMLKKFDECMNKNNFRYTLAFGSVLGAIREHGFIKHDLDIDTFMWIEDDSPNLLPELEKYGFHLLYHYSIDNDKLGKTYTFDYKGCHLDIYFLFPAIDKYPYCNDFIHVKDMFKDEVLPRRLELPISKEIRYTKFEDIELPIPINAEELCEYSYGKNYMIPDPLWDSSGVKNTRIEWTRMIPKTTLKEFSIQ